MSSSLGTWNHSSSASYNGTNRLIIAVLLGCYVSSNVNAFSPTDVTPMTHHRQSRTILGMPRYSSKVKRPLEHKEAIDTESLSDNFMSSLLDLEQANRDAQSFVLNPLEEMIQQETAAAEQQQKIEEAEMNQKGSLDLNQEKQLQVPPQPQEKSVVPSFRRLSTFLATTTLIWLSEPLLSLVDTTVVGLTQTGANAVMQLASMSPATTLMDTLLWMTYFLALATTNKVAEYQATNDHRNLQLTVSRLVAMALVLGGGVTLLTAFGGPSLLASLAGKSASPELIKLASGYTWIRASVAPLTVAGMVAQSACLVTGHTSTVAKAVGLATVSNLLGDMILTPRYGIYGAAAATAMASASSASLLLHKVYKQMCTWREEEKREEVMKSEWLLSESNGDEMISPVVRKPVPFLSFPDWVSFKNIVKLSVPLAFRMWATMFSYTSLAVRAADFGAQSLAAHNILLRVFWFLTCFSDSVGQTTQSFAPATIYPKFRQSEYGNLLKKIGVTAIVACGIGTLSAKGILLGNAASVLAKDAGILLQIKSAAPHVIALLALHPLVCVMEGIAISKRNFHKLTRTYVTAIIALAGALTFKCNSLAHVWRAMVAWQVTRLASYAIGRKFIPVDEVQKA